MTGQVLAILSTAVWCVGTGVLFVVLANWSAGNGSWSVVSGVVRGIRQWSARQADDLVPLPRSPRAVEPARAPGEQAGVAGEQARATDEPAAEVVELGSHRIG